MKKLSILALSFIVIGGSAAVYAQQPFQQNFFKQKHVALFAVSSYVAPKLLSFYGLQYIEPYRNPAPISRLSFQRKSPWIFLVSHSPYSPCMARITNPQSSFVTLAIRL